MKRLLCLISAMNTGGAETFLMKLYRQLDKTKYQMDFCVNIIGEGYYDYEIENMGGKMYHIPSKSENFKEFKKQLTSIVKNEKYEYVLRVTSSAMGFLDLMVAKRAGAKVCVARSSNSSDGGGVKLKVAHIVGRLLYDKYVDVKIAPSDLAAKYTFGKQAYHDGEVAILKNALDLNVYRFDQSTRDRVRGEFSIPEGAIVIGHIGRFSHQKNHSFLVDIFREIHSKNEDTILMLVGNGELFNEVNDKIRSYRLEDSVIFSGVRSDIPAILSAMDVFVFPSFYEGMPNVVIEAQSTGLPCIISNTITKEANITGLVIFKFRKYCKRMGK